MNKIPFTDYARDRVIAKLEELRSAGHDAKTLLDTAIERGWRTVFDPTDRRQNPTGDRRGPERALQWWESPEGIEQKALELKVAPPPANAGPQAFTVFKVRVFIAAGDGPWIARMDVTTRRFYDAEKDKKP